MFITFRLIFPIFMLKYNSKGAVYGVEGKKPSLRKTRRYDVLYERPVTV